MKNTIRSDFPIFQNFFHSPLIYLDSAATTFKPKTVIDAVSDYYSNYSSNIHRGLYPIALKASENYEKTREIVRKFINASSVAEIIFTKGATEALNLLANSLAKTLPKSSEILTTITDHHANFVPWQQSAIEKKYKFGVVTYNPLSATKELLLQSISDSISRETSIFTFPYVTNVFGVELPAEDIIKVVRSKNPEIIIVIDACQAVQHIKIDVQKLDCDFLVFSGHKIFGPTGTGILYGKNKMLDLLPPYQTGGDMIEEVAVEKTLFAKSPSRFEAGTPAIGEFIGLGVAIDYITTFGIDRIHEISSSLLKYAIHKINTEASEIIKIYIPDNLKTSSVLSFNVKNCHSHDVSELLAEKNICVRAGHHCAQPLHTFLDIISTCRASFSIYNTEEDVDVFVKELKNIYSILN